LFPNVASNQIEIIAFALILIRVTAFLVSWPVFSAFSVPQHTKILLGVALTVLLFPLIPRDGISAEALSDNLIWLVIREVFIGLCLGFLTRLFFFAVAMGGNFVATSMGLANAQIFNPTMNAESTTVETFFTTIATLLFLTLNGHHIFLTGLVDSFTAIPLSPASLNLLVFKESGHWLQIIMVAGVKISAPVMASIFFMNVVMGIVGRAIPQINVFVTSLPINLMVGFVVCILMLPLLMVEMDGLLQGMSVELFKFIKGF